MDIWLSFRDIEYVAVIAKYSSLTLAAQELYLSQPALSIPLFYGHSGRSIPPDWCRTLPPLPPSSAACSHVRRSIKLLVITMPMPLSRTVKQCSFYAQVISEVITDSIQSKNYI